MKFIRSSAEEIGASRRAAGAARMRPQVLLEATCSETSTKGNNVAASEAARRRPRAGPVRAASSDSLNPRREETATGVFTDVSALGRDK